MLEYFRLQFLYGDILSSLMSFYINDYIRMLYTHLAFEKLKYTLLSIKSINSYDHLFEF